MTQTGIFAADIFLFLPIALIVSGYFVFMFDMVLGGHDFATSRAGVKQVSGILKTFHKDSGVLYDLGSCRGNFIVRLLKYCPELDATGVDNNSLRIFFSKILSRLFMRPAHFIKGDMFKADVSKADAVYIYLDISLMPALEKKLLNELKPGALVVTNTQSLPNWQPAQTFITHPNKPSYEKMFAYVKK